MGIFHSKIAPIDESNDLFNKSVDPRSPTENINRSPISPIGAETVPEKPTISKIRDLTAELTEILDNTQTPDRAGSGNLQCFLDPRSPGTFLRTPLVLDESDASNISLRGSSVEYEEIDSEEGELSFQDCSANISTSPAVMDSTVEASGSIFSDTSLSTQLKADIESIVQKLYDTGSKDPRSPSVAILRTPIVLEDSQECANEEQIETPVETKQLPVPQLETVEDAVHEDEKITTIRVTVVLQDENKTTPSSVTTPKREKSDLSAGKVSGGNVGPRTPLGCVTNVKTTTTLASTFAGGNDMRKTALLGQMMQGSATMGLSSSAELIPGKKVQPRSKIPTFRMK